MKNKSYAKFWCTVGNAQMVNLEFGKDFSISYPLKLKL